MTSGAVCPSCHANGQLLADCDETCAYQVVWSINAHMKPGAVNLNEALFQHRHFRSTLYNSGAEVLEVPFVHAAYDSVFVKDNAVLGVGPQGRVAYLARPLTMQRRCEQEARREALQDLGFRIVGQARDPFEGGDLVVSAHPLGPSFFGYGQRSSLRSLADLQRFLGRELVPLKLVDPHFYHLDTALAVLEDGSAFACRDAFTPESWRFLRGVVEDLVEVPRTEALKFGLNWVEVGSHVVLGSEVPEIIRALRERGKLVHVTPLQQFQYAGGSAACLTARVHRLEH